MNNGTENGGQGLKLTRETTDGGRCIDLDIGEMMPMMRGDKACFDSLRTRVLYVRWISEDFFQNFRIYHG